MRHWIKDRRGSSAVVLAMVFVTFALCITAAIEVCRMLVVSGECREYGRVWTEAVLSEYDVHLLEDYGIMAYFGNEIEVKKRLDAYMNYSCAGRLDANIGKSSAALGGYELGYPANFLKALKQGVAGNTAKTLICNDSRTVRGDDDIDSEGEGNFGSRKISNSVVLDTLPSGNAAGSINSDNVVNTITAGDFKEDLKSSLLSAGVEMQLVYNSFGNHVTAAGKDGYYRNEWEYIIFGENDDAANFSKCRKTLFLIRNALNLAFLYKDPAKQAALTTAAELIAPGPGAVAVQLILTEAWATAETEYDIKTLLDNGRVPFIKTESDWRTDLGSIIQDGEVTSRLDEESRRLLDENISDIRMLDGAEGNTGNINSGQNYDDYLILLMLAENSNIRLLRIMDLVQINMKHRYYDDFNMMEYYIGVNFSIKANGRSYDFSKSYQ